MNLIVLYLITDILAFIAIVYSLVLLKRKIDECGITYVRVTVGLILLVGASSIFGFITAFLIVYFLTSILAFSIGFAKVISVIAVLFVYYLAYQISKRFNKK